jgi:sulfite oxidase
VSDGPQSDKWAWVLFEATLDVPANPEIVVKAVSEVYLDTLFQST